MKYILIITASLILIGCKTGSIHEPDKDVTPIGIEEMGDAHNNFFNR